MVMIVLLGNSWVTNHQVYRCVVYPQGQLRITSAKTSCNPRLIIVPDRSQLQEWLGMVVASKLGIDQLQSGEKSWLRIYPWGVIHDFVTTVVVDHSCGAVISMVEECLTYHCGWPRVMNQCRGDGREPGLRRHQTTSHSRAWWDGSVLWTVGIRTPGLADGHGLWWIRIFMMVN